MEKKTERWWQGKWNREKEEKIYSSVINNSSKCGLKLSGEIYAQVLDGTADKRSTKTIFLLEP